MMMGLLYFGSFQMRDNDYNDWLKQRETDNQRNSKPPRESGTERYWEEIRRRQVGENKPDYDPWTGGWY